MDTQTIDTTNPNISVDNKDGKSYDFAHLVMYCGKCGSKYILDKDIPGDQGIRIFLPPTSTSEIRLVCKECKNEMGLFYIESDKKAEQVNSSTETTTTSTENESVQENTEPTQPTV